MTYTLEEKIDMIGWYFQGNSLRGIRDLFSVKYPDRPIPCLRTISNVFDTFKSKGCIVGCKCHKTPTILNEDAEMKEIMVCAMVEENSNISIPKISEDTGVSVGKVHKILKKHKYHSYKYQTHQEILDADPFRRMEFCETVLEMANEDEHFIENIVFTDESTFPLHGKHNPSIVRYWAIENEYRQMNLRTQYPEKLNVWAGIYGNNILGPLFIDGNLNGTKYLNLLQQHIVPALRQLNPNLENIWFQQDGCPAHNSREVTAYLDGTFPNKIISNRGTIRWPARSPHLAPNDFFLWGYAKSKLYGHLEERASNLEELRANIENHFQSISPITLANVRREFYDRLGYCLAQAGGTFENLL